MMSIFPLTRHPLTVLCYYGIDMSENPSQPPKFRKIAELSSLGLILPSSIAVGLFIGYQLDKLFNSQPWMLIIFLLLGVTSGFISLYRGLKKYSKDL
jgi:F0F1-type ATP synthase assembly protein I